MCANVGRHCWVFIAKARNITHTKENARSALKSGSCMNSVAVTPTAKNLTYNSIKCSTMIFSTIYYTIVNCTLAKRSPHCYV